MSRRTVQRKVISLEDSAKLKPTTIPDYRYRLNVFYKWTGIIKNDIDLISMDKGDLEDLIVSYTHHLNNRVKSKEISANTVPKMYRGLKLTLVLNGRENDIRWKMIEALQPRSVKRGGYRAWSTHQVQVMLSLTAVKRTIALIHFMASTGARVGAFNDPLQMRHLVTMSHNGMDYYAVLIYADEDETIEEKDIRLSTAEKTEYVEGESYFAFLTPEAKAALDDYHNQRKRKGEVFDEYTPLFGHDNKHHKGHDSFSQLTGDSVSNIIQELIVGKNPKTRPDGGKTARHPDLQRKKTGRTYDIQKDHGFRKRFNTILKLKSEVNSNIAEKIIGHKNGLDGVYFTPTRQECFAEFVKAVEVLTIDESMRKEIENARLQSELDSRSQLEKQVKLLEVRAERQDRQIKKLQKQAAQQKTI